MIDPQDVVDAEALARVSAVIEAFEASDWQEIRLDTGQIAIHLSTSSEAGSPVPPTIQSRAGEPVTVGPTVPAPEVNPARTAEPTPRAQVPVAGIAVVSPSVGIFWRAPSPTDPPFVEVGDEVTAESPLGIVEVMKLMTQVTAGRGGRIAEIRVGNGERVEAGQVLLVLSP